MKSMKFVYMVAGLALVAGTSSGAFANDKWIGDETYSLQNHFKSTKTRDQVLADLRQAQARGLETSTSAPETPSFAADDTSASGPIRRAGTAAPSRHATLQPLAPGDTYYGD